MRKKIYHLLKRSSFGLPFIGGILLASALSAQTELSSKTIEIKRSNTVTMKAIMQADKLKQSPQMLRSAKERRNKIEEYEKKSGRKLNPSLKKDKNLLNRQVQANPADNGSNAPLAGSSGSEPARPILNFVGAELLEPGNLGVTPPDVVGDVGPADIVSMTNERVRIINKNNLNDVNSFGIDNFFTVGLGVETVVSDPHVRYDRLSGRWFFCAISINEFASNRVLLAVSKGSNIKDTTSFTFFDFPYDIIPGLDVNLSEGFFDYPTLGVDARSILIGGNIFQANYEGSISYVIDKRALLNGVIRLGAFSGGAASILFTPQGVQNDDAGERFSYFACVDNLEYSLLHVLRVRYRPDGAVAGGALFDISSPTGPSYPVNTKDAPVILDGLDDRFLAAMIMRNKVTDESTLVTAHQFHMDANGRPSPTGGRLGVRWYEMNNLSQVPSIKQKGTLVDAKCEQPFTFWNGSLAVNGQGHMLLSASRSSQFTFPESVISGRLSCDQKGYTQPPLKVSKAKGPYDLDFFSILFGGERWGDYSQVVVDPTDNMTMWAFGEFGSNSEFDTTFNWAVQVSVVRAPAPPRFKIDFDKKASDKIIVYGNESNCKGFFDPGPGYMKRLKAQIFGANSVQVKRINFIDPTRLELIVNDRQLMPGEYILVITNPDGQSSFQTFSVGGDEYAANKGVLGETANTRELKVFPSPANSQLTVQTNGLLANSTLQVYDMSGRVVMRKFAGEKQVMAQIDVSQLGNGTYIIQIRNNKETYINKFVVER
jgi:Secretion system C-terminal sorting domain